ncbi:MAG: acetyl-CoA carboxylase biotin carboxyl carrier protein [Geminicoccaceae bacterium]
MALPLERGNPVDGQAPEQVGGLLNVDTALIEKLAELLQRTGLTEIELSEGEARIRVAKQPAPVAANATLQPVAAVAPPPAAPLAQAAVEAPPAQAAQADANHPGAVRAPMVGTAYLTPEPGADPFVAIGNEVQEGQTLLIVEAMKVMNPIRAPRSGRVASIMVTNGDPVEYDELLLIID